MREGLSISKNCTRQLMIGNKLQPWNKKLLQKLLSINICIRSETEYNAQALD